MFVLNVMAFLQNPAKTAMEREVQHAGYVKVPEK
jgi:hypothetical protein